MHRVGVFPDCLKNFNTDDSDITALDVALLDKFTEGTSRVDVGVRKELLHFYLLFLLTK